jgi:hypothetical protein
MMVATIANGLVIRDEDMSRVAWVHRNGGLLRLIARFARQRHDTRARRARQRAHDGFWQVRHFGPFLFT